LLGQHYDMKKGFIFTAVLLLSLSAFSAQTSVDLVISYRTVNFTGKPSQAITVNGQIPGPTLRFKEGDTVTINVKNTLSEETTVHWHGLLVPWQMDGVMAITQRGIPPGQTFHYTFKLLQSGTYWYHSHKGFQEQEGLYGALIIEPKSPPPYHYDKDYVVVLSDWKNTRASHIWYNLKRDGEYYSPLFPLQPSLAHFIKDYKKSAPKERAQLWKDYHMMQLMRMGIYDISDIAYDALLFNGHPKTKPWTQFAKVGDVVRLRFIGASASTFFHIKMPGTKMKMVHVQGNNVVPYDVDSFRMGPGETNDVLVTIEKEKPYMIYAESTDQLKSVSGAIKTNSKQQPDFSSIPPFPEPPPVTRGKMALEKERGIMPMLHMGMQSNLNVQPEINTITANHLPGEPKPSVPAIKTIGTKYQNLKAAIKTNNPNKPIYKTIQLQLYGFMDKYIWFINGVPEYNAKPIALLPNKRYRLVFTNNTMMHHPMHLHGHWYIFRNGHGAYDPLLHTIDMPPGGQVTANLDTDASGQWFFHCHMLYHMMSGMARTFQYSSIVAVAKGNKKPEHVIKQTPFHNRPIVRVDEVRPIPLPMVERPIGHANQFVSASMVEFGADPSNNGQMLTFYGLYGPDFNKLQLFINDAEMANGDIENADLDVFYWKQISQFWSIKGGANYYYRPTQTPYWQPGIGIEGLMPYFISNNSRLYYHKGSLKLDVEFGRNTQLTNNLFLGIGIRGIVATKKVVPNEIGSGLNETFISIRPNYRLFPGITAFIEYENQQYYGKVKSIRRSQGESTTDNSLFLGLSFLF